MKKTVILLVLLQFVSGCISFEDTQLKVGTNIWPGYEPLYIAREKNYFLSEEIHLAEFTNTTDVMSAFEQGVIDAAAMTLDEALLLRQKGLEVSIILIMDVSHGGDAIISQKNITEFKQLKNKSIGVEDNALGAYFLSRALDKWGFLPNDVKVISASINEHEKIFAEKKVDAIVTFEPIKTILVNKGGNILFDSTMIPGEIVDVFVVNKNVEISKKRQIEKLLDSWFKAINDIKNQPNQNALLMQGRLQLTIPDILIALNGLVFPNIKENKSMFNENQPHNLLTTALNLEKIMLKKHLLIKKNNIKPLINKKFIMSLVNE